MRWWRWGATATLTVLLVSCSQGALAPRGPEASRLASLFWLMVALAGLVFLVVVVSAVTASLRGPDDDLAEQRLESAADHTGRERTVERWMVVGGGIALPAVVLGSLMAVNLATIARSADSGDLEVEVIAHQYWWEVRYDDRVETANEVHVPTGTPVELTLGSEDVIHSVWVPELGGKADAVPGRETRLVLEASEPGRYIGRCAEYCGLQHAWMLFEVVAHEPDDFEDWLERERRDAAEPTDERARRGREVFLDNACVGCHTIRGVAEQGTAGPDLTHVGAREQLGAGVVDNDTDQLKGWIVNPQTIKPGARMPPQQLDQHELDALVHYLESLE